MEIELAASLRDPFRETMTMKCPKCGWQSWVDVVKMPESPLRWNVLSLAHEMLRNELRGHPCILGKVA